MSSVQPIFSRTFDQAARFPLWFVLIAIGDAFGSFLNTRVGMRWMIRATYASMLAFSILVLACFSLGISGKPAFALFIVWGVALLSVIGLTLGNLSALAMEDMGAMAGFAASLMAAFGTLGSVILAVPVGQAFAGTPLPLLCGVALFMALALGLTRGMRKPAQCGLRISYENSVFLRGPDFSEKNRWPWLSL